MTVGKVYSIPPQPPVDENTRWLDAGALRFGVEYRELDPASLVATYAGNAAHLAELEDQSPEGGFTDEGVSIHVSGSADGHEYLRFDMFDGEPHYHYIHHGDDGVVTVNNVIEFDTITHGEMLPWVMAALRTRIPEMLTQAGASALAMDVDAATVASVLDQVGAMAEAAQQAQRAQRALRIGNGPARTFS